jgi:hypothetical protein
MKTNVGTLDGAVRLLLGLALLSLLVVGPKTWWGLVGLLPLTTAILGSCPLYSIFGLSTCSPGGRPHPRT